MRKKLLIFIALIIAIGTSGTVLAAGRPLEISYPPIPGIDAPTTIKTPLPDYIKYLFNFSIILAALIAFISLVYGGFSYLTSAGSPQKTQDARERIFAAILGLLLLLGSYIILATINPQLVLINVERAEVLIEEGVILYSKSGCPGGVNPEIEGSGGIDYIKQRSNISGLGDFDTQSVYFYKSGDETEVKSFPEINWKGEPVMISRDKDAGECISITPGTLKSLTFSSKLHGVYLLNEDETEEVFLSDGTKVIDDLGTLNFNDKTQKVKFVKIGGESFSVILHEDTYNGRANKSDCQLIHASSGSDTQIIDIDGNYPMSYGEVNKPSSAMVIERDSDYNGYVLLCKNRDCAHEEGKDDIIKIEGSEIAQYLQPRELRDGFNNDIKAIQVSPQNEYAVVLFEDAKSLNLSGDSLDDKIAEVGGACQAFNGNIPNLIGEVPIGKCYPRLKFWSASYTSCVSGVVIIPMK